MRVREAAVTNVTDAALRSQLRDAALRKSTDAALRSLLSALRKSTTMHAKN